jgi:hypothetical protein
MTLVAVLFTNVHSTSYPVGPWPLLRTTTAAEAVSTSSELVTRSCMLSETNYVGIILLSRVYRLLDIRDRKYSS